MVEMEGMVGDLPLEIAQKLTRKMLAFRTIASKSPENAKRLIEER